MRKHLSERNVVVVLFVMVLITFSLAQEDSKKMDKMYSGVNAAATSHIFLADQQKIKGQKSAPAGFTPASVSE
ncbi:MAG: hypothetical protein ABJA85_06685 [Bacteroidota bacterium]